MVFGVWFCTQMTTVAPKKRVYKKKTALVDQEVPANTIVALTPANAINTESVEDTRPKCNICDEAYNRMANTEV